MKNESKAIAVMTGGGDTPGMNAAIRGVYSRAKEYGYHVIGIRDGFTGLLNEDLYELEYSDVEDIVPFSGTVLGTSGCEEFKKLEVRKLAAYICRKYDISSVIVIGGEGSFRDALKLYEQGIGVIGIPAGIELDMGFTDYMLGFDTAVNCAMDSIDKIENTSKARDCYSVVEVTGRKTGYIAICCGIVDSVQKIIIPERQDMDSLMQDLRQQHLSCGTIVVAEGAGRADDIACKMEQELGVHARVNVLGFRQRGGIPTSKDRFYGCAMGAYAVDLIYEYKNCHAVAVKAGELKAVRLEDALKEKRRFPEWIYRLENTLSRTYNDERNR